VEFHRRFDLPARSFFLFGPRGVGKSHLLRSRLAPSAVFDLLDTRLQFDLLRNPHELEARIGERPAGTWIWIDEVQKVPRLLDEVHRLIEAKRWKFALSGSSPRKLHREGANLLGGRASTRTLEALTWSELSPLAPSVSRLLEWGTMPLVVLEPEAARDILSSYVATYVREEVREEGLVRKLEPFLRFLDVAGQLNGAQLNVGAVARDAQVPRKSVVGYFDILFETLMAHRLPAYHAGAKVREVGHPKFYWFDPGVARAAGGRLTDGLDELSYGAAFETLVFAQLRAHERMSGTDRRIAYYSTKNGVEIDFIVETQRKTLSRPATVVCIEVKSSTRWDARWEKPMREIATSGALQVSRMIGVYCGESRLKHGDVTVLPFSEFVAALEAGDLLEGHR
jgi:predicted AAA+ superfamily ATPase